MASRLVFCRSATRIFTSWPSVGPETSSVTTVNAGTPGGILGWSQQVLGAAACCVLQPNNVSANRQAIRERIPVPPGRSRATAKQGDPTTDRQLSGPEITQEKPNEPFSE